MDFVTILAATQRASAETTPATSWVPIDSIWTQITAMTWLQAVLAVSFGAVYMLYGWRIFKVLVVVCFGLVGLFAGIKVGAQLHSQIWGGVGGFLILAAVAIPLMRWAVSILGAVAGGILTGGMWYALELPGKYILAGALIGIIAGGMISFIVFKVAIMLFTSLGGGTLVIGGILSLLHQYESIQKPPTAAIKDLVFNHNWFLPALLLFLTAVGVIIQNKFVKGSQQWSL